MGFMCDFCAEQRSVIYCRSDAASLCLLCDRNVHSANVLSLRHSRTLLCERCNAQPAFVRCVEEKICLCPNCDWKGHVGSSSGSMHKRQAVSCYSGCPSAAELQTIWSFFLKIPSPGHPSHNFVMGSMSTTECPGNDNPNAQEKERISDRSVADEVNYQKIDKSNVWTGSLNVSNDIKLHAGSTYAASPLIVPVQAKRRAAV